MNLDLENSEGDYFVSRRRLLCTCAGGLLLSACGGGSESNNNTPIKPVQRGCLSVSVFANQAVNQPGCGIPSSTTGNTNIDNALRAEFEAQKAFWGASGVSFSFLNDCNSPNAYANPQDKSILFGSSLASKLLNQFGNIIPLWQVMAHEWGHQIQFALGDSWLNAQTVAPKELEADMFSGFYLMLAKNTPNVTTSVSAAFSLGDWSFNDPGHHGTPAQRGAAVVAGARAAVDYASGALPRSYQALRQRFYDELLRII